MLSGRTLAIAALLILTSTVTSLADAPDAPDSKGNYLRNEGPVLGTVQDTGFQRGALWLVVVDKLRGRSDPSPTAKVVMKFPKGTILQADVSRGGSDEVLLNAKDSSGDTWMRVRTRDGKDLNCYVRANVRYIKPVTK